MAKKAEEKTIESGKQKALRTISKILQVFGILGKICLWVGLVCVAIATVVFPLIMKDVNITKEEISYKTYKIELRENDDNLDIYYKDQKIGEMKKSEKDAVFALIEKVNTKKIIALVETALITAIVVLILSIIVIGYFVKLMKNINEKETPFIEENSNLIRKMAYYNIAIFAVSLISSGIIAAISVGVFNYSFDVIGIGEILVLFGLSYIFDYGTKLQEQSDLKIYE